MPVSCEGKEGKLMVTQYMCPNDRPVENAPVGCGSTNVQRDDTEPSIFDCLDCGLWFTEREAQAYLRRVSARLAR